MRRALVRVSPLLIAFALLAIAAPAAEACPMCNQSIANENSLPRAYMYSILFMLGMPATVFSGFGIFLCHKFRTHNAAQVAFAHGNAPFPAEAHAPHSDNLTSPA